MNQNTPNNPFAGTNQNQGQEGAQMNEHSQHGDGVGSNAYFANQQNNPLPDLDAGAPVLKSNEQQRLNRKALLYAAGVVGLLLVVLIWIGKGLGSKKGEVATVRQQTVDVPALPQAASEDLPLPVDLPPPTPPIPLANTTPTEPVETMVSSPSRADRRIVADGQDSGASGPSMGMQPGEAEAQTNVTSAQYIRNPDTTMLRGTYIRCVLETHIVTDVPGFTSCIVTEPVYSLNGRSLLLPKGSKVYGQYNTGASSNVPRVSVIWDRITTPNGIDVTMASPGVDNLGGAGHPGDMNQHWGSRIGSALLISMLSDGFKYAAAEHGPNTSTVTSSGLIVDQPFESNTARTMERLANDALTRAGSRPPTITINQGTVLNVYVAKDVDFTAVLRR